MYGLKLFVNWRFWLGVFVAAVCGGFWNTSALADSKVYISQVQITGGTGKTDNDFIELYNPSDSPFNLKGFRLVKRTANGTTDTSIKSFTSDIYVPAKGYFLWANSNFIGLLALADATTTGTLSNDNGIALRQGSSDTGTIIDSISWGNTSNIFKNVSSINPGAGQSLIRLDLTSDSSSFSLGASSPHSAGAAAFIGPPSASDSSQIPAQTSGTIYSKQSSDVHITEVLPDPLGEDSGQEAVELQNDGGGPVDLEGWILSDKQTSSSINPNAYTIHGLSLLPGAREVIIIPSGYFILSNKGDTLNLYFPDKTLADTVSFEDVVEGQSYQKISGAWVWAPPSLGMENFFATKNLAGSYNIFISEIFANPKGPDEGNEWVEVANSGSENADLKGFMLDFGGGTDKPSQNALVLDESAMILANNFLVVKIPEKSFELLNSGGIVSLFDQNLKLVDRVIYPNVLEGQSFAKVGNEWQFLSPTPAAANLNEGETDVQITRVYPSPKSGEQEFLEVKNLGTTALNLKGWGLQIGDHVQKINSSIQIPSLGTYIFNQDFLSSRLRNDGERVALVSPQGNVVDEVTYPPAVPGKVYEKENGVWAWTDLEQRDSSQGRVLGEFTTSASESVLVKGAKKTKMADLPQNESDLAQEVTELTLAVNDLKTKLDSAALNNPLSLNESQKKSDNQDIFSGLALAMGALALLIILVKQFWPQRGT